MPPCLGVGSERQESIGKMLKQMKIDLIINPVMGRHTIPSGSAKGRPFSFLFMTPFMHGAYSLYKASYARIFQCLNGNIKAAVPTNFVINSDNLFISWIERLVDLRNNCAHHDRLFNRSFQKQSIRHKRAHVPTAPAHKLKALLECLDYMLERRGLPMNVTEKVGRIIRKHPDVQPAEAGY